MNAILKTYHYSNEIQTMINIFYEHYTLILLAKYLCRMPSASSHKANSEIEHEIQPENESDHNAVVSVKTPTKIQLTEVHSFRDASDNNGPPDDKSHRQQNMLVSTDISKSAFPIPSGMDCNRL